MFHFLDRVNAWFQTHKNFVQRFLFVAILLGAAFFRLWNLDGLPVGFHSDEVMNGYVGQFILRNGQDLYGNAWPILHFDHFGDYPNVLPMYLSGISSFLFGSSVWAVRLPIALLGVATVGLVYWVARWLWKPPAIALLAAGLLAVLPWHILLSRATAEGITASFVFLFGFFVLFRSIEKQTVKGLVLAAGLLFLTYLLYPGFRIGVPLALLPAVFFTDKRRIQGVLLALTGIAFVLTFSIAQTVWGKGRFEQTSFLAPNSHIQSRTIQYSTAMGEGKAVEARLFYNKYLLTGRELVRQYASYFSPDYLVGTAGLPPRYVGPEQQLLYWTPLGVLALAIIFQFAQPKSLSYLNGLFQKKRAKYIFWILWLILTAPVPAALTYNDVPNIHRSVLLSVLLPFVFAPAWYLISTVRIPKKSVLFACSFVLIAFEIIMFWQAYTRIYSNFSGFARQDEQLQLAKWLKLHASEYDEMFVPGNEVMPLFYLFAQNSYPKELAGAFTEGIRIKQLGNITFVEHHCPSILPEVQNLKGSKNILVADRSECDSSREFKVKEFILHEDTKKAYDLMEFDLPATK